MTRNLTLSLLSCLFVFSGLSPTIFAQEGTTPPAEESDLAGAPHDEDTVPDAHAGHDHSAHQDPSSVLLPGMDFVFTESPDDHVIGAADAPVTIIAYASVTCPHCGDWFTHEWPKLKADHIDKGHVRFIMREYPTNPQMLARAGFAIINCAPEEEYFTHLVGQMQSQKIVFQAIKENRAQKVYEAFAQNAGLKTSEAMYECLNDKTIQTRIDRAIMRAQAGGIKSVPNFIMNGERVSGDLSAQGFSAKIENLLNGGMSHAPDQKPVEDAITLYEGAPE